MIYEEFVAVPDPSHYIVCGSPNVPVSRSIHKYFHNPILVAALS